jgi:hypothetical protein
MTDGYIEFEFDLHGALLNRLVKVLDEMDSAQLRSELLSLIPDAQGVYQLFLGNELVYIGKTDADAGLRRRLERHSRRVQHRIGLDPADVSFKAVRIYVFTAVDLEAQLIQYYGGLKAVKWNGSGFGSNDPGRRRDKTNYREEHFDWIYPIDLDREVHIDLTGTSTAADVFLELKDKLPYWFRFQRVGSKPHPDLEQTNVEIGELSQFTARSIIECVVSQLPTGWQATRLPSHVILYKEDEQYPQGDVIARS